MTLPDPNNPQAGDRFTDPDGTTVTVLYVGKTGAFVEYAYDEMVRSLASIAKHFTPLPPSTPGPDELWIGVDEPGEMVYTAHRLHAHAVEDHDVNTPIVRYVKADPQ